MNNYISKISLKTSKTFDMHWSQMSQVARGLKKFVKSKGEFTVPKACALRAMQCNISMDASMGREALLSTAFKCTLLHPLKPVKPARGRKK